MAVFRQLGPVPVWPYFFLSVAAGALGMVFLAIWLPNDYPAESEIIARGRWFAQTPLVEYGVPTTHARREAKG